jgi:hypothetical protein
VGPAARIGVRARLDDVTVIGGGAEVPAGAALSGARLPEPDRR